MAATGPLFVNVNAVPPTWGNNFEVPHPVIASASPSEAPRDGFITITGSGFGSNDWISPNGNSVVYIATLKFNGFTLNKVSWNDTSITARIPSNLTLGCGSLVLTRYSVDSNVVPFTVEGAPMIASISPATSGIGSTVTISAAALARTSPAARCNSTRVTGNRKLFRGGSWVLGSCSPQVFNLILLGQRCQLFCAQHSARPLTCGDAGHIRSPHVFVTIFIGAVLARAMHDS
jgi:hypothetical protein